jgi:hypothetical protein
MHGRKFIELCRSSSLDEDGYLRYRFGSFDKDGKEGKVDLEYPHETKGSLQKFFAAVYQGPKGFVKSVRFVSGNYDYTVYTRDYAGVVSGGVEVHDRTQHGVLRRRRPLLHLRSQRLRRVRRGNAGR